MRDAGWSGMMSLPRMLTLDRDGSLRIQISPQMAALRNGVVQPVTRPGEVSLIVEKASGEILCTATREHNFTFSLTNGSTTLMHVSYDAQSHALTADGEEFRLGPEDKPRLHAFIDGSVIELIGSERTGYTKPFYYEGATAPGLQLSVKGAGVLAQAWKITPISKDRLTTPASA